LDKVSEVAIGVAKGLHLSMPERSSKSVMYL
jgi:hypothetical protein